MFFYFYFHTRNNKYVFFILPTVHLTHRTVSNRHEKDDINGDAVLETVIVDKKINARVHGDE